MRKAYPVPRRSRRFEALMLCVLLAAVFLIPAATALGASKIVRVGWYETPFNRTDSLGRRSGYAYEYQRKIAAYTGWRYEYVEGSWPELLEMLKNGEIDLMSDVSYMESRAGEMLFAALPMGTEAYFLYITSANKTITSENPATLNGMRVGVTGTSIQKELFIDWAEKHGVRADLVEMDGSEEQSLRMLKEGKLDAFVTLDTYASSNSIVPVWKIGSSDFYFAVSKNRPELLAQLDAAMNRIQDENIYYNQQLTEEYLRSSGLSQYLTNEEKAWLSNHGKIRVGYQDNYLAFCAADDTGALIGALKDYLFYASEGMLNAKLEFEAIAYPTASAAVEALKKGEVDCMFPANFSDYEAEQMGVSMSPMIMRTEMDAVVRESDRQSFLRQDHVTVAVNEGNPNYDLFLTDHYPDWYTEHYPDTPACLDAVAAGKADCIIISNYRFGNISKKCRDLNLTTVSTGVDLDYCFATRQDDTVLYSILSRTTGIVPSTTVGASLTYYSAADAEVTVSDMIKDNLATVMSVVAGVLFVILILLLISIRSQHKAAREKQKVADLNKRVNVDALTRVRNKGAFSEYIQEMQERLDRGEQMEFAVGVFDCNDLKAINDENGHDKGDEYLKAACRLICRIFHHSPVFRIGGDEFAVVLEGGDFENRESLVVQFEQFRQEICKGAENEWNKVEIALGIAVYDPEADSAVTDVVRRADKIMYEHKRQTKAGRD